MHQGQVPGALGTILEGDAHIALRRLPRQRLPKRQQLGEIVFERLVKRISSPLVHFQLNDRAGKTRNRLDSHKSRHLDGALENGAGRIGLPGIERILVMSANGRDAHAPAFRLRRELLRERLPIGPRLGGGTFSKAHPLRGPKAQPLQPVQLLPSAAQNSDTPRTKMPENGPSAKRKVRRGRSGGVAEWRNPG
jgi:hypothetical protein